MWNSSFDKARALVLAALMATAGGCDRVSTPPLPSHLAGDTQLSQSPNARYRIDPTRNRMWVLTHDGVLLYDIANPKVTAEVTLPGWQELDAHYSCPAALALGPKGEALVTSNAVPTLWRIDPETLAVSVHELVLDADTEKDVGFSGLAYSAEYGMFFAVSGVHGSLWRIDPLLRRGQQVQLSEPLRNACGVAVRSRIAQHKTDRLAGLCVHTQQGNRTVTLAPDHRSAQVHAGSCRAPLTQIARKETE